MTREVLDLKIERALGVRNRDIFGKQDPFCIVKVLGKAHKTKIHHSGGRCPVWNENLYIECGGLEVLKIELWDYDFWKPNDSIGFTLLKISEVRESGQPYRVALPVYLKQNSHKTMGCLIIQASFLIKTDNSSSIFDFNGMEGFDLFSWNNKQTEENRQNSSDWIAGFEAQKQEQGGNGQNPLEWMASFMSQSSKEIPGKNQNPLDWMTTSTKSFFTKFRLDWSPDKGEKSILPADQSKSQSALEKPESKVIVLGESKFTEEETTESLSPGTILRELGSLRLQVESRMEGEKEALTELREQVRCCQRTIEDIILNSNEEDQSLITDVITGLSQKAASLQKELHAKQKKAEKLSNLAPKLLMLEEGFQKLNKAETGSRPAADELMLSLDDALKSLQVNLLASDSGCQAFNFAESAFPLGTMSYDDPDIESISSAGVSTLNAARSEAGDYGTSLLAVSSCVTDPISDDYSVSGQSSTFTSPLGKISAVIVPANYVAVSPDDVVSLFSAASVGTVSFVQSGSPIPFGHVLVPQHVVQVRDPSFFSAVDTFATSVSDPLTQSGVSSIAETSSASVSDPITQSGVVSIEKTSATSVSDRINQAEHHPATEPAHWEDNEEKSTSIPTERGIVGMEPATMAEAQHVHVDVKPMSGDTPDGLVVEMKPSQTTCSEIKVVGLKDSEADVRLVSDVLNASAVPTGVQFLDETDHSTLAMELSYPSLHNESAPALEDSTKSTCEEHVTMDSAKLSEFENRNIMPLVAGTVAGASSTQNESMLTGSEAILGTSCSTGMASPEINTFAEASPAEADLTLPEIVNNSAPSCSADLASSEVEEAAIRADALPQGTQSALVQQTRSVRVSHADSWLAASSPKAAASEVAARVPPGYVALPPAQAAAILTHAGKLSEQVKPVKAGQDIPPGHILIPSSKLALEVIPETKSQQPSKVKLADSALEWGEAPVHSRVYSLRERQKSLAVAMRNAGLLSVASERRKSEVFNHNQEGGQANPVDKPLSRNSSAADRWFEVVNQVNPHLSNSSHTKSQFRDLVKIMIQEPLTDSKASAPVSDRASETPAPALTNELLIAGSAEASSMPVSAELSSLNSLGDVSAKPSPAPLPPPNMSSNARTAPPPPPPPPPPGGLKGRLPGAPPAPPPGAPKGFSAPGGPHPPGGGPTNHTVMHAPEVISLFHNINNMLKDKAKTAAMRFSKASEPADASALIAELKRRGGRDDEIHRDVKEYGPVITSLAKDVQTRKCENMEDLLVFVRETDEKLSVLSDMHEVLKHFDWPEARYDAMREASILYKELKGHQQHMSKWVVDSSRPNSVNLADIASYYDKLTARLEQLTRDGSSIEKKFAGHQIPWQPKAIFETKRTCLRLMRLYMDLVVQELQHIKDREVKEASQASKSKVGGTNPFFAKRKMLIERACKFVFRVHQFVGGLDLETKEVFFTFHVIMMEEKSALEALGVEMA